ncbi:hypothetical protein OE88DRAFT_1662362 [Heliocybe sulcata]|uniref:DUF6534 domain-containing protein n=1 Tax=Heliocybe sulcata TaxID=5364 RepID=A0A5C3MXS8_9AGAM|nr:hypothetical protein OE88DRAFT_1662362 [Heliocybe sulcata]
MSSLSSTLGALWIGGTVSTALYGFTCGQMCWYFRRYSYGDPLILRGMVALTWALDTVQHCLILHSLWWYLIARCNGNLLAYREANWSLLTQVIPSEVVTLTVEIYFVARVSYLAKRKWVYLLVIPAAVATACAIVFVANGVRSPSLYPSRSEWEQQESLFTLGIACYVFSNFGTAIVLCTFLYRSGQYVQSRLKSVVQNIIGYTVATGLLASLLACSCLITYIALSSYNTGKATLIYVGIYFTLAKVYINSMLTSLNGRGNLRTRLEGVSVG